MTIVELSQVFSALFAGCSVLAAIYIYQRNTEKENFKEFRNGLVKYQQLSDEASELFDHIGLVEVGYSISNQLSEICPKNPNKLLLFLFNEENENLLRQAIYLGLGSSKTIARSNEILKEIQKIPTAHREAFPITHNTLSILNAFLKSLAEAVGSGDMITELFCDAREQYKENPEIKIDENDNIDLTVRDIGVHITILHTDTVENLAESIFQHAEKISVIIVQTYESKSDKELRAISKRENKLLDQFRLKSKDVKSYKSLFEYLKFYKFYVSTDEWDVLVESKALIEKAISEHTDE